MTRGWDRAGLWLNVPKQNQNLWAWEGSLPCVNPATYTPRLKNVEMDSPENLRDLTEVQPQQRKTELEMLVSWTPQLWIFELLSPLQGQALIKLFRWTENPAHSLVPIELEKCTRRVGIVATCPAQPQRATRNHWPLTILCQWPRRRVSSFQDRVRTRQDLQQGLWALPQKIQITEHKWWRRTLSWREGCRGSLLYLERLEEQEAFKTSKQPFALPHAPSFDADCVDGGGGEIYMQLLKVIMMLAVILTWWEKHRFGDKESLGPGQSLTLS